MRIALFSLALAGMVIAGCARGDEGPGPRPDAGMRMDAGLGDGGGAIDAPPPLPCGRETAACCSGTCDPGLDCVAMTCVRGMVDGGPDPIDSGPEPIDGGPSPIDGGPLPIDAGRDAGRDSGSDGGPICGMPPLPCCIGSTCSAPYVCVSGSCVMSMPDAGTPCGMSMQPCCSGSTCTGGLGCVGGTCMPMTTPDAGGGTDGGGGPPCGFFGTMCCAGGTCIFPGLACMSGFCLPS